jgi:DNA-binding response OmpR family regulator
MKDLDRISTTGGSQHKHRAPCVLIVEDEPFIALDLEQTFAELKVTVRIVDRVGDALSCPLDSFDVAVLDIDVDGEEAWPIADWLKAEGKPYIISSGLCADPGRVAPNHCDAPLLAKPVAARQVARLALETLAIRPSGRTG